MHLLPLLLVLCIAWPAAGATTGADAIGKIVDIRPPYSPDDMQLRKALSDQNVTSIVFTTDYNVGQQFSDYSGPYKEETPLLVINRNVTLTGLPGQQPLLDLNFQLSVAELCDMCTLTIKDMAITNDRRGANAQLDFFLGRGNSVLNLTNVIRKRLSCTSIEPALRLVKSTQRSPRFPAHNGSMQQVYAADDITFQGRLYPRTLHLIDYSVEFPRHYNGGYSVVLQNVYRMCDNFVDNSCLEISDADQCVYEHIGQLLEGRQGSSRGDGGTATALSAGSVAGIAVSAVVVAAALAALLWLLLRRHRSAQGRQAAVVCRVKDVELGAEAGKEKAGLGSSSTSNSAQYSSALGTSPVYATIPVQQGAADSKVQSNTASSSNTAVLEPVPGFVAAAYGLQFGALLGSGSFGRVYHAKWRDRDVAVKVIEHDSRMAAAVANEVQLMLSCNHVNVVRAFHFIAHVQQGAASSISNGPGSSDYTAALAHSSIGAQAHQQQQQQQQLSRSESSSSGQQPGKASAAGLRCSSLGAVQQLLTQEGLQQGSDGSSAAAAAEQALQQQQQQLQQVQQHPDQQQPGQQQLQQQQSQDQQQQQEAQVKSGLLGHDLPPALPRATSTSSAGGGIVGFGPCDLLGSCDLAEDDQWESSKTWLIQEFCDSGTLSKMSSSWLPAFEDDAQMLKRLVMLQDVAQGLRYLHSRNVVHGDLNARNVLITSNPSSLVGFTAKLADLGLSRTIKQHATHHTTCTVGTMSHMPPELLRYGRMSTNVDMYSFAVMMWELYCREVAFRELHYGQFFEYVVLRDLRPKVPPHMPEDYRLLMERCWSTSPADRPSSKMVCECLALMIADRQQALGLRETSCCANAAADSTNQGSP